MWVQNRQGEVKNCVGNGEAKELTCVTHGHKLRGKNAGGRGGSGQRGITGRKKWGNSNSIINKMYLKKETAITEHCCWECKMVLPL